MYFNNSIAKILFFKQKLKNIEMFKKYDVIVFGPIVSELGWEILMWSGFIRGFKKIFPEKKVIVITRSDRYELYNNCVDQIYTFDITNDYCKDVIISTNQTIIKEKYLQNKLNTKLLEIKQKIYDTYNNVYMYDFLNIDFTGSCPINLKICDYNFTPNIENKNIINKYLKTYSLSKIPTVMYPRHRIDYNCRNWCENGWYELYEKIENYDKFVTFVTGKTPAYIKPNKQYKNIINLEDLCNKYKNTSIIGLTIEALKLSKFSFGIVTWTILLSNILNIPYIYLSENHNLNMADKQFQVNNSVITERIYPTNIEKHNFLITSDIFFNKIINFIN